MYMQARVQVTQNMRMRMPSLAPGSEHTCCDVEGSNVPGRSEQLLQAPDSLEVLSAIAPTNENERRHSQDTLGSKGKTKGTCVAVA